MEYKINGLFKLKTLCVCVRTVPNACNLRKFDVFEALIKSKLKYEKIDFFCQTYSNIPKR
jgi:hypothetical protein